MSNHLIESPAISRGICQQKLIGDCEKNVKLFHFSTITRLMDDNNRLIHSFHLNSKRYSFKLCPKIQFLQIFFSPEIFSCYRSRTPLGVSLLILCENRNDPDLVQAFLKKWWVESDFKAPNFPLSLRLKGSGCHYNSIYNNTGTK